MSESGDKLTWGETLYWVVIVGVLGGLVWSVVMQ